MKIYVTGIYVDDQEKALKFYTEIMGFEKKEDIPLGEYRWLTLVEAGKPDSVELLLEPNAHPAVEPYRAALMKDGIPSHSFEVNDVDAEYGRLKALGVEFTTNVTDMGTIKMVVLKDGCGNLIQLLEKK